MIRHCFIYKYKKYKHKPEINFEKVLNEEDEKNTQVAEFVY